MHANNHLEFVNPPPLPPTIFPHPQAQIRDPSQTLEKSSNRPRNLHKCLYKWHARIQEFSSGGGPGQSDKKALATFFFESSAYFTEVKWLNSKKTIIFQGSRGGPTFSRGGGSNFFQGGGGVQLLIPYRNPYNL